MTYSDDDFVTAQHRIENAHQGGRAYLNVPREFPQFEVDEAGEYLFDIIAYRVGQGNPMADPGRLYWERQFAIHWGIGPNEDAVLCNARSLKTPCYICEYVKELKRDYEANKNLMKSLFEKQRQLFGIVLANDRDATPRVWDISYHNFGKKLDAKLERGRGRYEGFYRVDDRGKTIAAYFEKASAGEGRTYLQAGEINFEDRADPFDKSFYDRMPVLDDFLIVPKYDDLRDLFLQSADASIDPGGSRGRARGRGMDADDDQSRGRGRGGRVSDDDAPARGRGRGSDDDDAPRGAGRGGRIADDDQPARGRGRDSDDQEAPARGGRNPDREDDAPRGRGGRSADDDQPARGRGRNPDRDDAPSEDDKPAGRGRGRGKAADEEPAAETKGGRGRGKSNDDDAPAAGGRGRGRGKAADEDKQPAPNRPKDDDFADGDWE